VALSCRIAAASHVISADTAHARKLGIKLNAARRTAWHILEHDWEMQSRAENQAVQPGRASPASQANTAKPCPILHAELNHRPADHKVAQLTGYWQLCARNSGARWHRTSTPPHPGSLIPGDTQNFWIGASIETPSLARVR
jgi:hypothetical protein